MKKIVALVLSLVMVLGLATTALAATAGLTFYTVAADGSWAKADQTTGLLAGKDLDDVAYGEDENCLPCFNLPNYGYMIEVPEANAEYKLTYGAKNVFLKAVPDYVVEYVEEASVLKVVDAEDAVCGDWAVTDLDEDDVYYAHFTKKGVCDGLYVADEDSTTNVLVNGKLVAVDVLTPYVDVEFMGHVWAGNDVVNYEYTTVKCTECGNVAKLYANATAAGKNAQEVDGLGWITAADAFNYGVSVPSVDTDKVESAETFDAGIAMYVGMSVMAAAGSAVVLKKKD